MNSYRRLRVDIYPGTHTTLIAVTAQTVSGGHRRDRLLLRTAVDTVDASTLAAALRVAGDECHDAADRLL